MIISRVAQAVRRFPVYTLMGFVPIYLIAYFVRKGTTLQPLLVAEAGVYLVFLSSVVAQAYIHRGFADSKVGHPLRLVHLLADSSGPVCLACAGTMAALTAHLSFAWTVAVLWSVAAVALCLAFGAWGLVSNRTRAIDQLGLATPLVLLVFLPQGGWLFAPLGKHANFSAFGLVVLSALIWRWCAKRAKPMLRVDPIAI